MREMLDEEHRAAVAERLPIERELAQVARRLERTQQMGLDGALEIADPKALSAPLKERRHTLEARLAQAAQVPQPVRLHPSAADAYRRLAETLHLALEGEDAATIRDEVRKLIERVDFT